MSVSMYNTTSIMCVSVFGCRLDAIWTGNPRQREYVFEINCLNPMKGLR